jgi:DNA replication and repair protein RecF
MTEQRGERPILLLDDVLSELDPQRRRFVQRAVRVEGQTLITSADAESLDPAFLRGAETYRVERGTIRPGASLADLVREAAGDYTAHTGEDPSDDDGNE